LAISKTTISRTTSPTATPTILVKSSKLDFVYGITIDEGDNLYVAVAPPYPYSSYGYPLIYRAGQGNPGPNPTLTLIANLSGDGQGHMGVYQGICYYNQALYVPRVGQLTKIDPANNNLVTRFAGSGQSGFPWDNTNSSAVFDGATHCIADPAGIIYVGEMGGGIRIVSQQGNVGSLPKQAQLVCI
jgi:hypothetical protein